MGIKTPLFYADLKKGQKTFVPSSYQVLESKTLILGGIYSENCCAALTFDRSLVLSIKINENCHCH
jgi:hypothetical protein